MGVDLPTGNLSFENQQKNIMFLLIIYTVDVKKYYDNHMKYVTEQVQDPRNLIPSLLESNTIAYATSSEWENEWNEIGLDSRLSEEDYKQKKRDKMLKQMKECFRQTLKNCTGLETSVTAVREKVTRIKGSRFTHTEKLQFTKVRNFISGKKKKKSGIYEIR